MDYFEYQSTTDADTTIQINIKVEWGQIEIQYQKAINRLAEKTTLPGFRQGKAPIDLVKNQLTEKVIYDELVAHFIPTLYSDLLKKTGLKPHVQPSVSLKSAKPNETWEIVFSIAEAPIIEIPEYKKIIVKLKKDNQLTDIWVPGKDESASKTQTENREKLTNMIIEALLSATKIKLSHLIIDQEIDHRLARLVDDIQKLGMTVDSYLATKKITLEEYKNNLMTEITEVYKLQLLLESIANIEKIVVNDSDLDRLIANSDKDDKKVLEQNRYIYSSILRRNKTLDFLLSL